MKHTLPSEFTDHPIRIAVVGCGGNGSQFLNGLARLDLSLRAFGHPGLHVTAHDPDLITEANVGRQLFSPSDIGTYKSEVIINRINCYYGLQWEAYATKYNLRDKVNILVGCVDSAASRRALDRTKFDYWLDLGNTNKKGQVIMGQKGKAKRSYAEQMARNFNRKMSAKEKTQHEAWLAWKPLPTVMDIFPELKNKRRKEDTAPSCSLAEALERQDLFINQTVSTFALQLLWQFVRQGGLDIHGYFINLETGKVTPLPIK